MSGIDTIKILGSLLGSGSLSKGSGGNVLGSVLGSVLGGGSQSGGGVADVLGSLLGGGQSAPQQQSGGGLGDLLGGLLNGGGGSQNQSQGSGALGSILGGLLGGGNSRQQQGGGVGDLLGSVLGGNKGGILTGLLGAAVSKYAMGKLSASGSQQPASSNLLPKGLSHSDASSQAELMIRAMINAAKSDGSIDKDEQEKIVGQLGEVSNEEAAFVRSEFEAPLDASGFARSIPDGMEQQIYLVSLMAIDLDTKKEAKYLDQLASGLNISHSVSNQIHEKMGAPTLY